MTTVGTIQYDVRLNLNQLKGDTKQAEKIVEGSNKNIEKTSADTGSKVSNMFGTIATAAKVAGAAAVTAFGGFSYFGLKTAGDLQATEKGFITLLGNAEDAARIMARIKDEAKRTPFEIQGLSTATQLLTSVTKDGDKAIDFLLDVGESLAAMGKGQNELDRIIVNLQQIGAVGKASMLDVKQFAFAGIPIFEMLQETTGKTGEALEDMISDGEVTFQMLEKMFKEATDEGGRFAGAFKNQAGSFNQSVSNMKDTFMIFASDFVKRTGIFDGAVRVITQFSDVLSDNQEQIFNTSASIGRTLVGALKLAIDVLRPFVSIIKTVVDFLIAIKPITVGAVTAFIAYKIAVIAINAAQVVWANLLVLTGTRVAMLNGQVVMYRNAVTLATVAQAAWNAVLALNPIGLAIGAVVGLTAALTVLFNSTNRMTAEEKWANETKERSIEITKRLKESEDSLRNSRRDQEGAAISLERAQRTLNEALATYGEGSLEAREAALNVRDAQDRLNEANKKVEDSTKNLTEAQKNQRDMLDDINDRLSKLDGRSVNYSVNGKEMYARNYGGDMGIVHQEGFSKGGFTGRGGINEPAGMVHRGEYVIPQKYVDQNTGMPKQTGSSGSVSITLNMDGVMARSRADLRDIAKDMISAINEELRAKGKMELAV